MNEMPTAGKIFMSVGILLVLAMIVALVIGISALGDSARIQRERANQCDKLLAEHRGDLDERCFPDGSCSGRLRCEWRAGYSVHFCGLSDASPPKPIRELITDLHAAEPTAKVIVVESGTNPMESKSQCGLMLTCGEMVK